MLLIIKKISINSHYKISPFDKSIFKIPDEKKCLICKSIKLYTLYEISVSSLENKNLIKKVENENNFNLFARRLTHIG